MKKVLFIKILKYLGVALIGAFVGIGALAGVSSCYSNNKKQETPINEHVKHSRKLNSSTISEVIGSNKTYYAQLRNYSNPLGFLYSSEPIKLENSRVMASNYLELHITGQLLLGNNVVPVVLSITTALNGGVYKLSTIRYYTNDNQYTYIYSALADSGSYSRENSAFMFTNAYYEYANAPQTQTISYLNELFDVYDLSKYKVGYDFTNAFNFNNFYQVNETFYAQPYSPVVGATTTTTNWTKTYTVGLFYSGGLMFNRIRVTFERNLSYYFETAPNSNEYLQFPTNVANAYNYYFLQMEYVNSVTGYAVTACNRTSYTKSGNSYIQFLPAWAGQNFKTLEFQTDINDLFIRSVFNSLSDNQQLNQPISTSNVGLDSVFNLLSSAFTAWLPIFNISIVPGITIGLLLFLPLIVGIIILVIWIVKR